MPEFVVGTILSIVFAVELGWFPVSADVPDGLLSLLYELTLPAVVLALALFGSLARVARAATLAALDADYTRTATLKGLPSRTVLTRHVLPNVLPPTIAAIGAHVGYLVGGLVVVETLFSYPGLGKLLLDSATAHDLASLEACVLATAVVVMAANLVADVAASALDPRLRRARPDGDGALAAGRSAGWQRQVVGRRRGRRARARRGGRGGRGARCSARRRFSSASPCCSFWVVDAVAWPWLVPYDPQAVAPDRTLEPPSAEHWFGTDDLGRDVFSRVLAGASSVLIVAPAAALLAVAVGVAVGLVAGYLGGATDEVLMRVVDALLAFPLVVGAVLVLAVAGVSQIASGHRHRRGPRAADSADRSRSGSQRARTRVRGGRSPAR